MAKPLQVTPIFAPTNYVESELDRDDAGTGQSTPDLPSSIPVQYIESSNLFQSAPLLDLGTKVKPEFNLDITGIHQDASSLPFSRPVYTTSPEEFEMAEWPYSPYCPIEDAYCCTGDYAPETNDFLEGCSPCMFSFSFSFRPSLPCAAHVIEVHAQGKPQKSQGRPEEQNVLTLRNIVVQTFW